MKNLSIKTMALLACCLVHVDCGLAHESPLDSFPEKPNQSMLQRWKQTFFDFYEEIKDMATPWSSPFGISGSMLYVAQKTGPFECALKQLPCTDQYHPVRLTDDQLAEVVQAFQQDQTPNFEVIKSLPDNWKLQLWHYLKKNPRLLCSDLQDQLEKSYFKWRNWNPSNSSSISLVEILTGPLERISFHWMTFTPEIIQLLQNHPTLEEISISNSQLSDDDGSHLAAMFKANQTVKRFSVDRSQISHGFIRHLVNKGLQHNNTLEHLTFYASGFYDFDAFHIADYLKINSSLVHLYIGQENMGPEGGIAIINALKSNTTLKSLALGHNPLGDAIVQPLLDMLKVNRVLNELWLDDIHLSSGKGVADIIQALMERKVVMERVELSDMPLAPEHARVIAKSLENNQVIKLLLMKNSNIQKEEGLLFIELMKTDTFFKILDIFPVAG
ncbi:MAG TPA: hypothetical protein VNJ29_01805, partial [Candidatus Nitrosotenuis sp.]|nr:hypothetical protein [Candidatus Nitrosotenuis sp.]